eukprot:EG_transcript_43350
MALNVFPDKFGDMVQYGCMYERSNGAIVEVNCCWRGLLFDAPVPLTQHVVGKPRVPTDFPGPRPPKGKQWGHVGPKSQGLCICWGKERCLPAFYVIQRGHTKEQGGDVGSAPGHRGRETQHGPSENMAQ